MIILDIYIYMRMIMVVMIRRRIMVGTCFDYICPSMCVRVCACARATYRVEIDRSGDETEETHGTQVL